MAFRTCFCYPGLSKPCLAFQLRCGHCEMTPQLPCHELLTLDLLQLHSGRMPGTYALYRSSGRISGQTSALGSIQMKVTFNLGFLFSILSLFLLRIPNSSSPLDEKRHISQGLHCFPLSYWQPNNWWVSGDGRREPGHTSAREPIRPDSTVDCSYDYDRNGYSWLLLLIMLWWLLWEGVMIVWILKC